MSTERLESSEEELKVLLEELQSTISHQLPRKEGDDRRRTLHVVERKLDDAEDLLRDVQVELRLLPKAHQYHISNRVTQYKADLASLRRQLHNSSSLREELFSKEDDDDPFDEPDPRKTERELLLKNTQTLQRASDHVYRAQQISAQTDNIADDIMVDLSHQKSSLIRTRDRAHGIDREMDRTKSLLRTLFCKTIENKLLLIIIIVIEVLILIGIAYWKFFSK